MYLAMPAAAGSGITVGKDGKSITVVDKTGWTYTQRRNVEVLAVIGLALLLRSRPLGITTLRLSVGGPLSCNAVG